MSSEKLIGISEPRSSDFFSVPETDIDKHCPFAIPTAPDRSHNAHDKSKYQPGSQGYGP